MWREFGTKVQVRDEEKQDNNRFAPKPLETRSLWTHPPSKEITYHTGIEQGSLQLWVDIMTPPEAKLFPLIDISPPSPAEFELRVVVWKTRAVVDDFAEFGCNDLYVMAAPVSLQRFAATVHPVVIVAVVVV